MMSATISRGPSPGKRRSRRAADPALPLDSLRRALQHQRDAENARLATIDGTAYDSHRSAGDEHVMFTHLETIRQTIADTDYALRRIANGTYGTCERCAEPVPLARLEVRPHARYCVHCQQRLTRE